MKTRLFFLFLILPLLIMGCREGIYVLEGITIHVQPEPIMESGVLCTLLGEFTNPQIVAPASATTTISLEGNTLVVKGVPAGTNIFTFSIEGDREGEVLPGNAFPAAMLWHSQNKNGVEIITLESFSWEFVAAAPPLSLAAKTAPTRQYQDGWIFLKTAHGTAVFKSPLPPDCDKSATTWGKIRVPR